MSGREAAFAAAVAAGAVLGCASAPAELEPEPRSAVELELSRVETAVEAAFLRGLVAYRVGHYERARAELERVAIACPTAPIGGRAFLAAVGLELDPRNPGRDPEAARELARRYFQASRKPAWTEPAMEALYLLALELAEADGADEEAPAADTAGRREAGPDGADGVAMVLAGREMAGAETAGAGTPEEDEPEDVGRPERGERNGAATGADAAAGEDAASDEARLSGESAATRGDPRPTGATLEPGAPALLDVSTGGFRCESGGAEHTVGALEVPVLPDTPLYERLRTVEAERSELREDVGRLEQRVAELLQELERIRTTLQP